MMLTELLQWLLCRRIQCGVWSVRPRQAPAVPKAVARKLQATRHSGYVTHRRVCEVSFSAFCEFPDGREWCHTGAVDTDWPVSISVNYPVLADRKVR